MDMTDVPYYKHDNTELFMDQHYMTAYISCSAAPLQIQGQVSTLPFYYRERHNTWSLEFPEVTVTGNSDTEERYNESLSLAFFRILRTYEQLPYHMKSRKATDKRATDYT